MARILGRTKIELKSGSAFVVKRFLATYNYIAPPGNTSADKPGSRTWQATRPRQNKGKGTTTMLTITPTAVMENDPSSELEVYAVIDGKKVYLPEEATYVMQDRRGLWFYSSRKPRLKEGDWTPNKISISCRTERGYVRALKTDSSVPWLDTCQRTVRVVNRGGMRRPIEAA
jgi:hypothetical protein